MLDIITPDRKTPNLKDLYIVFLDCDGVLNSDTSVKTSPHPRAFSDLPAEPMIGNLNRLLLETKAKVVVSSSWRNYFGYMGMKYLLYLVGVRPHDCFLDITPRMWGTRGREINKWLEANKPKNFVILDDCDDMDGWTRTHLVQTNSTVGLTNDDVTKAIDILFNKPYTEYLPKDPS